MTVSTVPSAHQLSPREAEHLVDLVIEARATASSLVSRPDRQALAADVTAFGAVVEAVWAMTTGADRAGG